MLSTKQTKSSSDAKAKARQVTLMLNNLRGEHFRHEKNLSRRPAPRAPSLADTNPTLPLAAIYAAPSASPSPPPPHAAPAPARRTPVRLNPGGVLEYDYPRGPVPGPPIPRSWSGVFKSGQGAADGEEQELDSASWRREALGLVYEHLPASSWSLWAHTPSDQEGGGEKQEEGEGEGVLPLTLLCMHALLAVCDAAQLEEDVAPYVLPHVKRNYLRWAAVRAPLGTAPLLALCGPERAADGELVVVGPYASLPAGHFKAETGKAREVGRGDETKRGEKEGDDGERDEEEQEEEEEAWDAPTAGLYDPPPLTTLVLLDTALPADALLALPPTLVRIALLHLRGPTPVFRLPRVCPLVEVADFSFNPWVGERGRAKAIIERFEWARWGRLRVLGVRGCGVGGAVVRRVNEGRWTEVEVVGVEECAGAVDGEQTQTAGEDDHGAIIASAWT